MCRSHHRRLASECTIGILYRLSPLPEGIVFRHVAADGGPECLGVGKTGVGNDAGDRFRSTVGGERGNQAEDIGCPGDLVDPAAVHAFGHGSILAVIPAQDVHSITQFDVLPDPGGRSAADNVVSHIIDKKFQTVVAYALAGDIPPEGKRAGSDDNRLQPARLAVCNGTALRTIRPVVRRIPLARPFGIATGDKDQGGAVESRGKRWWLGRFLDELVRPHVDTEAHDPRIAVEIGIPHGIHLRSRIPAG